MSERELFEAWAQEPPREWLLERYSENSTQWPGAYKSYTVHCAWDAWQAARAPLLEEIESARRSASYWKAKNRIEHAPVTEESR
jgi:hypothetical protein